MNQNPPHQQYAGQYAQIPYATPPTPVSQPAYQSWMSSATPAKAVNRGGRRATARPAYAPQPSPAPVLLPPVLPGSTMNLPQPVLTAESQAYQSTYASRLRTGATLLMQPIIQSATPVTAVQQSMTRGGSRRGANVINYTEPGSGDEIPDAGALDSDDSDFQANGGTRALRTSRIRGPTAAGSGASTPGPPPQQLIQNKSGIDQSYLGMIPPSKYITSKPILMPTDHTYFSSDIMEAHAEKPSALIPIRVEFETDTHRVRDCFVWNLHEDLIKPDAFARIFCIDLDLPLAPWVDIVTNQIQAQLQEHEGVASMELVVENAHEPEGDPVPECRVILSIDVQVATHHLLDTIEWDLLSPLTPEDFAQKLCMELGLSGEAPPLIAHAIHEEIIRHKKDAIQWGVIGGDPQAEEVAHPSAAEGAQGAGLSVTKDKTGLGMGWGRAPRDGRGPKALRSVWRDWADAEEFRTSFEPLTAEEIEVRENDKGRATRRLRRETSKFQNTTRANRSQRNLSYA